MRQIKFNKTMMNGQTREETGLLFPVESNGCKDEFALSRKRGMAWWTHYRTGYLVGSDMAPTDLGISDLELIEGFQLEFEIGVRNLAKLMKGAAGHPTVNEPRTAFATELTPEGEQTVIPGCEKQATDDKPQLSLW